MRESSLSPSSISSFCFFRSSICSRHFSLLRPSLRVSIAFLGSDHLADFAKREAQLLALEDQRKPRPIALRIEPAQALAMRRDQPLVLVKSQRAQPHVELARQLADGEGSLAAGLVSFRGLSSPHLCDRGFHVAGIIHFDSLAFVLRGFARPHGPLARR